MSHELERITDQKSIRGFERSIAFDRDHRVRVTELWQCALCRSYWEYYGEHTNEDGLILQDGGLVDLLRGRQEGGCL
jgi:hypothetical protein